MEDSKVEKKEMKKTWVTPKLVVYGDVDKITKEMPIPPVNSSN